MHAQIRGLVSTQHNSYLSIPDTDLKTIEILKERICY